MGMPTATPLSGQEPKGDLKKPARYSSALALLSVLTLVLALVLLICGYLEAWHLPYFEERYAPSLAVAHGQRIYHIPPDGPLMVCLYAPLSYLAFLPVAVLPTVKSVFVGGSLLATAFLVIPLAVVTRFYAKHNALAFSDWRPILLLPLTAIASLRPLNCIATLVTADAPSTCLLAFSAWFLYKDCRAGELPTRRNLIYSSLSMALGLGCKQDMVFAALALIACVFYFFGCKCGLSYLAFTALFGIMSLGIVVAVYHDIPAIYFNSVLVGLRYTVVKANLFPGAYRVFANTAVVGLPLAAMWLVGFVTENEDSKSGVPKISALFFVIAATSAVSDVRFYAGGGGDVNDLSHGLYFLILGFLVVGFELLTLAGRKSKATFALRTIALAGALTLVAAGLPLSYNAQWRAKIKRTPSAVDAFAFDKQHPGQVYFPCNAIAIYLAEHKFYTTEWGVLNLEFARQRFSREEILKFIPANAQYVAIPRDYITDDSGAVIPYVAPHQVEASVPSLENFLLYRIER